MSLDDDIATDLAGLFDPATGFGVDASWRPQDSVDSGTWVACQVLVDPQGTASYEEPDDPDFIIDYATRAEVTYQAAQLTRAPIAGDVFHIASGTYAGTWEVIGETHEAVGSCTCIRSQAAGAGASQQRRRGL